MRMKRNWMSWAKIAMPYVLTALVPVIAVFFLGSIISNHYQERILTDKQSSVEASFERMLQKVETVEDLSYIISANNVIQQYSRKCVTREGHEALELLEVMELFQSVMDNPVVDEIYLFDRKDGCVIASTAAFSEIELYFRYTYDVVGCSAWETVARLESMELKQRYFPAVQVKLGSSVKEILEYRVFIPMEWIQNTQSQLIFALDTQELFRDFADILSAGGEIYAYDRNDILVYSAGTEYEPLLELSEDGDLRPIGTPDRQVYGTVLHSPDGNWKLKVYIPDLLGQQEAERSVSLTWVLVLCSLVASTLLSIYFTHRNHSEILALLNIFRGHTEAAGEPKPRKEAVDYRAVREYADKIITENNRFKERIPDYEDSRKYKILDKLIRSTYKSPEEAQKALAGTDIQIKDGKSVAICIRYAWDSGQTKLPDDMTVSEFMKGLLRERIQQPYELFDTSTQETVCLIAIAENEDMEIIVRDIISRLNIEVAYGYGIQIHIGAGEVAQFVCQLNESYAQACEVIRYSEAYGSKINLYSELIRMEDVYYYPREYDEKIYNYVVAGKEEEAKRIIQQVWEENFGKNSRILSEKAIEKLKHRLWECVASLAEKYDISLETARRQWEAPQNDPARRESIQSFFDTVGETVDYLAEEIRGKRNKVQNNTVGKILAYVQENLWDNGLSLKQISLAFGIHESYISNIFKNACGENLSVYIERRRIEKARDMVKNTDMRIRDIAEAVGYTSDTSFRRAFKKITGISPGEYREQ